jgi:molybdenum cofactor biosynthesis enzyme MoaA
LNCFFCHNEAMENPRNRDAGSEVRTRPPHLGVDELLRIIHAFTALGGRQVNITGGEPLAHPEIVRILTGIEKRNTQIVLNTNAVLAERLLSRPKIDNLDALFVSLHTTDDAVFQKQLGGSRVGRVMDNIVALKRHGYTVQINYSLGAYNKQGFQEVLTFAIQHGLPLKVIALVRPNEEPGFYGGDWIDPGWISHQMEALGAGVRESTKAFGGWTTTYALGESVVKVKNIAQGRLMTDFCSGCPYQEVCGEGIYGLRVGVDGLWKPCLLRRERFLPVTQETCYESQILSIIDAMIGHWPNARFVTGAPR